MEPDAPPDFFEETKGSADSLVEQDAPSDLFVELTLPQRLPVEPDLPPDLFEEPKDSAGSLVELDPPPDLFEDPGPPPAPDYGAGPSLGPICGTESATASICGAKPSSLATGGGEFPPGVLGGSRSYIKLIGGIYQIRGELLNKAMPPEPMVPKKDCTLVVQLLMELPEDGGVCFYPTPSLQETIPDVDVLDHGESPEVAGLHTCHHYVGDIAPGELQPAANQPSRPDGLDRPFDLVRLGWREEYH